MTAAVIFDLDGTLIDSEPLSREAWTETLAAYGYVMVEEDWSALEGRSFTAAHQHFASRAPIPGPEAVWDACLPRLLRRFEQGLAPFDDALPALTELRERGIALALVTSSRRSRALPSLRQAGLADWFTVTVTGDDVIRAKPAAEPYLTAAQRLGALPADCVAVEDSPVGVASARAAGMPVLAVRRRDDHDLSAADAVVARLDAGQILALADRRAAPAERRAGPADRRAGPPGQPVGVDGRVTSKWTPSP